MIIKTLRWKVAGFNRLVSYVGKERDSEEAFQVFHNMRPSESLEKVARQFEENDEFRKRRKNGVVLYHEILSFHSEDREKLTTEKLQDMAERYLELRAPNGLGFAMPHLDESHAHVHIALSGVEYRSKRTLRMDNRTFTILRRNMEKYQMERYPELDKSIAHIPKKVRSSELQKLKEREQEVIDRCFEEATGLHDFLERVDRMGVETGVYPYDLEKRRFILDVDEDKLRRMDDRMAQLTEERGSRTEQERIRG